MGSPDGSVRGLGQNELNDLQGQRQERQDLGLGQADRTQFNVDRNGGDPFSEQRATPFERLGSDPDLRAAMSALKNDLGWETVGGRAVGREIVGTDFQKVEGRLPWLPKKPWYLDRPTDHSVAQLKSIIDKSIAGERLGPKEKIAADWLAGIAGMTVDVPPLMTADELKETSDLEGVRERGQSYAGPLWFSGAERLVEQAKSDRGTGEQWLGYLKNKGAKPSELKWTGADEWLASQKKAVTKSELLDYLKANRVEVTEVVKGEQDYSDVEAWWNDEGGANEEKPYSDLTDQEPEMRMSNTGLMLETIKRAPPNSPTGNSPVVRTTASCC